MDLHHILAHVLFWRHQETLVKPEKVNIIVPKPKADIPIDKTNSRAWKGLVLHHSATPDGQARDWDGIRRYHMSYRISGETVTKEQYELRLRTGDGSGFQSPWKDIGYHAGIEYVNGQLSFQWGRPLSEIGAHAGVKDCSNLFNTEYLGLCVVGNFDLAPPKSELWDFALQVVRTFMTAFGFGSSKVLGHREVFERLGVPVQKSCPGSKLSVQNFRNEL